MEGGVTDLVRMFTESENSTVDARKLCERDIDYRDNKQLTSEEISTLEKRGQPPVIYNRIQRKVDYLSGLEKQQRKDPKAFPRNPDDQDAADAATDAIRYVCDDTRWDDKRSMAWDDILTPGTGAVLVGHKMGKDGPDPEIHYIAWDRFFYDPHSSKPDFSDARYMGIVTWYDIEEAQAKWPEGADLFDAVLAGETSSETYDDKPKHSLWGDAKRRRVRVIEGYYKKRGVWFRCVACKAGELEAAAPSPYLDEDGKPENPIKAMSLYVDRDNNRFGAVRVMISPQDEINKRRSKALHLITMRQFRMGRGAVEDKETIRKELAKPDGGIMADDGDFQILETADMARGNFEMLIDAKNEIDLLGANAALSGKNENDMSGRAILAQQQGGMVEVARMFDRLRTLSIEVYRAIWNRIRQFWTEEKWVRVTDDERNLRFVGLNQKITVKMLAQEVAEGDEKALQKASQLVGPQLLQAAMQGDEQASMALGLFVQQYGDQVVEVRNAVNELDVDIVIDEGMDTPSVQAEQFEMLAKVLPTAVNLPPPYLKALILASSLRGKDQLIEEVEKASQGPQIPPEVQQQMQEAMQRLQELEAENQALKLDAQGKQADVAIKHEEIGVKKVDQALKAKEIEQKGAELEVDVYRAQTERMEKMAPIEEARERNDKTDAMSGQMVDHVKALAELVSHMSKPKRRVPVRDENGFIVEIREEAA